MLQVYFEPVDSAEPERKLIHKILLLTRKMMRESNWSWTFTSDNSVVLYDYNYPNHSACNKLSDLYKFLTIAIKRLYASNWDEYVAELGTNIEIRFLRGNSQEGNAFETFIPPKRLYELAISEELLKVIKNHLWGSNIITSEQYRSLQNLCKNNEFDSIRSFVYHQLEQPQPFIFMDGIREFDKVLEKIDEYEALLNDDSSQISKLYTDGNGCNLELIGTFNMYINIKKEEN